MEFETFGRLPENTKTKRWLKFTPLEFETLEVRPLGFNPEALKFTPLEFETADVHSKDEHLIRLKFTPLEFETYEPKFVCD